MADFWSLFSRTPKVVNSTTAKAVDEALQAIKFPSFNYNIDDGEKIAALIICSKIIAQDIARIPLKLYRKDEEGNKVILRDDIRHTLLHDRPSSYMDIYSYKSTVEFLRSTQGNSYVEIIRDEFRNPIGFKILANENIAGPYEGMNDLTYIYKDGDKERKIHSADILHFKNLSSDGYNGRDPKDDLRINLGISFKALSVVDNFYNNGAILTKVLESTIPEGVDPDTWRKQLTDFEEKYVNYLNSGKVAALPPFTKLNNVGTPPADAEYINTVKYNNGQIASYFGIPQHKIGNIESSKFNSLSDIQADYIENTLSSIMEMYRREYELKLLTPEEIRDGYSIEFETNALYITDSKTRWENYKNAFGIGAITPNKVAQLENLPTYEGGNDHYLMSNYMSVEAYNAKLKKELLGAETE